MRVEIDRLGLVRRALEYVERCVVCWSRLAWFRSRSCVVPAVRCAGWRTAGSSTTRATSTTRSLRTKRRTRRALHHPHPRRRAVPPVLLLPELGELPLLLLLLLMRRPRQLSSPPSPSTTPSLARQARVFPKPPSLRRQQMARTQPRRCGCVCSRTSGQTSRVRAGPRQVPPQPRAMRHRLPRRSARSYACCW